MNHYGRKYGQLVVALGVHAICHVAAAKNAFSFLFGGGKGGEVSSCIDSGDGVRGE